MKCWQELIGVDEMAKQKAAEDEADDNDYLKENPSFFVRFKHWLQN